MSRVKIPPVLRAQTGGEAEIETSGSTVGDVLRGLAETHPGTRSQLFSDGGELNRYVNVYLNDEDVRVLDGLDTAVADSDTVVILPAMAGGANRPSPTAVISLAAGWDLDL
jgi:molybdopterin synthase sulfur carrier subunit